MTMIEIIYRHGHLKVMASFDLGDPTTLKHSTFLWAIQELDCILISDS